MTTIYIDENFAHQIAKGLDIFQSQLNKKEKRRFRVVSMYDEYRGQKDEDWIPILGKQDSILITQDLRIHHLKHQKELYIRYNLGVFFFKPPKNGYSFWQMVEQIIKHWPDIKKNGGSLERPFAFCITKNTFKRL